MNTLKLKRSSVPGKIPTVLQLPDGELAVNTADKKLYFGANSEVVEVAKQLDLQTHSHVLESLDDVVLLNPTVGQTLTFNGANWINLGNSGDVNGGGAAKRIWSQLLAPMTGTSIILPGVTAPLSTEGTQVWSNTLVPFAQTATYVIQTSLMAAGTSNNSYITLALFRNAIFIGGTMQIVQSSNNSATLSFSITDLPNSTTPVTYQVRIGVSTGQWYVNRRASEVTYGGLNTGWVMWEY